MTAVEFVALLALAAPLVQIAVMGFIGYPLAQRRPGGMDAFHRSGVTWWISVLVAISLLAVLVEPDFIELSNPSAHIASLGRLLYAAGVALALCLLIELGCERVLFGAADADQRTRANAKYEGGLPKWARTGATQLALLVAVAVLEEFVFRSVALGGLWLAWGLSRLLSAGLVVLAFGLAHWYYGVRQVAIKLLVGSVLVWCAFTGGWVAAALAHGLLNVGLTLVSTHRSKARIGAHG